MTQPGFTTFIVGFSNGIADVKGHKRRQNFAVHGCTVQ